MSEVLQERRRLNEEIEKAFINAATIATRIQTFKHTERGMTALGLYEGFFSEFSLLVMLTSDLPQLRGNADAKKEITRAEVWICRKSSSLQNASESAILSLCCDGVEIFRSYKRILSERGVIALPNR